MIVRLLACFGGGLAFGLVALRLMAWWRDNKKVKNLTPSETPSPDGSTKSSRKAGSEALRQRNKPKQMARAQGTAHHLGHHHHGAAKHRPDHPFYFAAVTSLPSDALSVSIDAAGSRLAVACADKSLRVFHTGAGEARVGSIAQAFASSSTHPPPYFRAAVEGDYCTACALTPDGSMLLSVTERNRTLLCHSIPVSSSSEKEMKLLNKPKDGLHVDIVKNLFAPSDNFVISTSTQDDTQIKVWSVSTTSSNPECIDTFDTKQVKLFDAAISPAPTPDQLIDPSSPPPRFIATAAWTAGVKILSIKRDKANQSFQRLEKVMDLKTTKGTTAVAFSHDATLAVVAEKHGELSLWNIAVRWHLSEDPKQMGTRWAPPSESDSAAGKGTAKGASWLRDVTWHRLAVSPSKKLLAAASNNHLAIFRLPTFDLMECIDNAHTQTIHTLFFFPGNVTTATSDGKENAQEVPRDERNTTKEVLLSAAQDTKPLLWAVSAS